MSFTKLSKLVKEIFHLPKRPQHRRRTFAHQTDHPPSSTPPFAPVPPSPPDSLPSSTSTYRIPVEIIERILSFVFLSSTDPTKSNIFSSPSPHPIQLLLVSKGLYHLVLPFFYRSISILNSQDWITVFNKEYGILGGRRLGMGRASLEVRRGWVEELFVQSEDGGLVWIPWDFEGARKKGLRLKQFTQHHPLFLGLRSLGPPLPNLRSLFILPSLSDPLLLSSESQRLQEFFLTKNLFGISIPRLPRRLRLYRMVWEDLLYHALTIQESPFYRLRLERSLEGLTFLHHPLMLRPRAPHGLYRIISNFTWIVDCGGLDEESLEAVMKSNLRSVVNPWVSSPYFIPGTLVR